MTLLRHLQQWPLLLLYHYYLIGLIPQLNMLYLLQLELPVLILASSSGALVDWLDGDWGIFFILTTIMVIPSLICLWFIKNKKINFTT